MSYDNTIGTLLVGVFFNTFLYGLVTYQFVMYYQTKFNDRRATRYMVLFLFILDTLHSVSAIYMAWYYVVKNHVNPAALAVADWPHIFTPLSTALTAFVTQIYLGFRIWRLTNRRVLYGVVILLGALSFILAMITSIEAWTIKFLSELYTSTPFVIGWLFTQVAVDAFITVTLVTVLSRSRTGFRRTDTILNRFIRGAIQTGLFAGIFSLGDLVAFAVCPDLSFYIMFGIPLGRIYTNTLLDILLTRELLMVTTDLDSARHASIMIDSVYLPPTDSQAMSVVGSTGLEGQVQWTAHGTGDHSFPGAAGKGGRPENC